MASANANQRALEAIKPKKGRVEVQVKERAVVNPELVLIKRIAGPERKGVTVAYAKKLLGYITEMENVPMQVVHGKDVNGKKFFCEHNVTNRFIDWGNVRHLTQEILRRRWRMNGEPIIIGKTGLVLNGQHQLLALIMAGLIYAKKPGEWHEFWQEEPFIDKVIVAGVEEDDHVVNTLDTAKPRTLSDVIGRSEYFSKLAESPRKKASKVCDFAIRLLWKRTGADYGGKTKLTHAEALDFLSRHPKLLKCVKHIIEEDDKDKKIKRFLPLGTAAGLLYLMGSSATERENDEKTGYSQMTTPTEDQLDWSLWDAAQDFWTELAGAAESMKPLRKAYADLFEAGCTGDEKIALAVKAWCAVADDKKLTPGVLALEYVDNDGVSVLDGCPVVGGIDLGNP